MHRSQRYVSHSLMHLSSKTIYPGDPQLMSIKIDYDKLLFMLVWYEPGKTTVLHSKRVDFFLNKYTDQFDIKSNKVTFLMG